MPRYDYRCGTCGSVFEVTLSIKSDPTAKLHCAACEARNSASRQIGAGYFESAKLKNEIEGYPYISNQRPLNLEGCRADEYGRPIFDSKSHEIEIMARHGLKRR